MPLYPLSVYLFTRFLFLTNFYSLPLSASFILILLLSFFSFSPSPSQGVACQGVSPASISVLLLILFLLQSLVCRTGAPWLAKITSSLSFPCLCLTFAFPFFFSGVDHWSSRQVRLPATNNAAQPTKGTQQQESCEH